MVSIRCPREGMSAGLTLSQFLRNRGKTGLGRPTRGGRSVRASPLSWCQREAEAFSGMHQGTDRYVGIPYRDPPARRDVVAVKIKVFRAWESWQRSTVKSLQADDGPPLSGTRLILLSQMLQSRYLPAGLWLYGNQLIFQPSTVRWPSLSVGPSKPY